MADAQASGACSRKAVWVQVPSPARLEKPYTDWCRAFYILSYFQKGLLS